jgi:hypothetical protein
MSASLTRDRPSSATRDEWLKRSSLIYRFFAVMGALAISLSDISLRCTFRPLFAIAVDLFVPHTGTLLLVIHSAIRGSRLRLLPQFVCYSCPPEKYRPFFVELIIAIIDGPVLEANLILLQETFMCFGTEVRLLTPVPLQDLVRIKQTICLIARITSR